MIKESWKDVINYEGLYQVSNLGRIKSLTHKNGLIRKTSISKNGYERVVLSKKNIVSNFLVSRLVAQAFIPNPENKPQVNHKDENKKNNHAGNLEFCTCRYNSNYGSRNSKIGAKARIANKGKHYSPNTEFKIGQSAKKIICIELNKEYNSITQASNELKIAMSNIVNCCKHKKYNKSAGGYHFEYK